MSEGSPEQRSKDRTVSQPKIFRPAIFWISMEHLDLETWIREALFFSATNAEPHG
jgi:hypothetical protein